MFTTAGIPHVYSPQVTVKRPKAVTIFHFLLILQILYYNMLDKYIKITPPNLLKNETSLLQRLWKVPNKILQDSTFAFCFFVNLALSIPISQL